MWYNKDQICETKPGKRVSPSKGAGILDTVASTGADLLIHHGIPWLGKKAVEMGRYYGSEALRNNTIQYFNLTLPLRGFSVTINYPYKLQF